MIDIKGRLNAIILWLKMLFSPVLSWVEGWMDAGIDATTWAVTNPATGTAWTIGTRSWLGRGVTTVPAANETARLVGVQPWDVLPNVWATNTIQQTLRLEFEMKLANVANMDNAITFFGLTSTTADTRASNDIVGFALAADVLQTVTDDGATETVNTGFGEDLTLLNLFAIEIKPSEAIFYLNGTQIARHITNLPDNPMYVNYYVDTEAGGTGPLELGKVRVKWQDRIIMPDPQPGS